MDGERTKKNLRLGIVGLGQCGGAMALSFALSGYESIAINTSITDLRGLDLPDSRKFHLTCKNRDGVGRDRDLGGEILRANAENVLEVAHRTLRRCEHLIVCGGLAGGTGGNLGGLIRILNEFKRPVTVLGALPATSDSTIDKFNAVRGLADVSKSPVYSIALVDNGRLPRRFPKATVTNLFRLSNNFVAGGFDYINKISVDPYYAPVQVFDGEDFRKVLTGRGAMIWGMTENFLVPDPEGREKTIKRMIIENSVWPDGYNLASAKRAALIISAPDAYIRKLRGDFWGQWVSTLSNLTKGCACYYGLFRAPEGVKPRLSVMFSGMDFPDSIVRLMDSTRMEAQMLQMKLDRDLGSEEMEEAGQVELFEELELDSVFEDIMSEQVVIEAAPDDSKIETLGEEEDGDTELEEQEQREEKRKVLEEKAGKISEEAIEKEVEHEAKSSTKRKIPALVYLSAAIVIVIAAFLFTWSNIWIKHTPESAEQIVPPSGIAEEKSLPAKASKLPAQLVKLVPSDDGFSLVLEKDVNSLKMYNAQGTLVKEYKLTINETSIRSIPKGVFFTQNILASEGTRDRFYPLAIELDYPTPLEDETAPEGDGIYLGGYPGTPPEGFYSRGNIILESADAVELSSFVKFRRTPVIVSEKASYLLPEELEKTESEIAALVNKWRDSWSGKDLNSFIDCFSDYFKPRRGNMFNWVQDKRKSFKNAKNITVKIDKLQIFAAEEYVVAEFEQDFST
ncbi:MAG: hypothetical protein H8E46_07155, partial [FCB group bacterium]|nr:hypothetical protein [FCB group bacterium]